MKILQYNKFIVALLGTISAGLTTWANGAHWANTIIAGITALLVYLIPNVPKPTTPVPAQTTLVPGTYGTPTVATVVPEAPSSGALPTTLT
jgi:hypothetical protein